MKNLSTEEVNLLKDALRVAEKTIDLLREQVEEGTTQLTWVERIANRNNPETPEDQIRHLSWEEAEKESPEDWEIEWASKSTQDPLIAEREKNEFPWLEYYYLNR